jgi:hypothetical protein
MPDDNPGEGIEHSSVRQRQAVEPVYPPAPPNDPPSPPAQGVSNKCVSEAVHAIEDRVSRAEKFMIGLTAAIALFAFGTIIVGIFQWSVMSGQLAEMKSGGADTKAIAIAAGKQADSTKDLADRMKDQAIQTKVIADQAKVSAGAARSAALTAISTLHVSERAYVAFGPPQWDMDRKTIDIQLQNNGHIPSGRVEVVTHEATVNVPTMTAPSNLATAIEKHWERTIFQTIAPNIPMKIVIPIIQMNTERLKSGLQLVMVVGFISYSDGFENSPLIKQLFCVQSLYSIPLKQVLLGPCDPAEYLPKMESVDGYPENQQKNKTN